MFLLKCIDICKIINCIVLFFSFDFKCRRQGIIDRYSMPAFSNMQVGRKPVPLLEDLLASLGLSEADYLHMVVMPSSLGGDYFFHLKHYIVKKCMIDQFVSVFLF